MRGVFCIFSGQIENAQDRHIFRFVYEKMLLFYDRLSSPAVETFSRAVSNKICCFHCSVSEANTVRTDCRCFQIEKKACAKRSQDEYRTWNLILPCEIKNVGGEIGTTVYNWVVRGIGIPDWIKLK